MYKYPCLNVNRFIDESKYRFIYGIGNSMLFFCSPKKISSYSQTVRDRC